MLWQILKGFSGLGWPETSGLLTSSGIEKREGTSYVSSHWIRYTTFEVKVTYAYTVEGRPYEGHIVQYGWLGASGAGRIKRSRSTDDQLSALRRTWTPACWVRLGSRRVPKPGPVSG